MAKQSKQLADAAGETATMERQFVQAESPETRHAWQRLRAMGVGRFAQALQEVEAPTLEMHAEHTDGSLVELQHGGRVRSWMCCCVWGHARQ